MGFAMRRTGRRGQAKREPLTDGQRGYCNNGSRRILAARSFRPRAKNPGRCKKGGHAAGPSPLQRYESVEVGLARIDAALKIWNR